MATREATREATPNQLRATPNRAFNADVRPQENRELNNVLSGRVVHGWRAGLADRVRNCSGCMVGSEHHTSGSAEDILVRTGCSVRHPARLSLYREIVACSVGQCRVQVVVARGGVRTLEGGLTLPSSGRLPAGFAAWKPPLMSNVKAFCRSSAPGNRRSARRLPSGWARRRR